MRNGNELGSHVREKRRGSRNREARGEGRYLVVSDIVRISLRELS